MSRKAMLDGYPDWNPISRNTGPLTSKEADRTYTLTKRQTRCREVLELIRDYPGHTAGELGRLMHEKYPDRPIVATAKTPGQRISDLFDLTLISKGPARKCTDSGNMAQPVYITVMGERELDRGGEGMSEPCAHKCRRCIREHGLKDPYTGELPLLAVQMILCPECGNKRCPKASDHKLKCTGSNAPGQPGSVYE